MIGMTTRHAEQVGCAGLAVACAGLIAALAATTLTIGHRTQCQRVRHVPAPVAIEQQSAKVIEPSCTIVEWGHYTKLSETYYTPDTGSVTGVSGDTMYVEFTDNATEIARQLHDGFGIRYVARDVPQDAEVRWHVTYPEQIRGFAGWSHDIEVPAGAHVRHVLYDFDFAYEMVKGNWLFEIEIAGKTRCGFTFTVK